LDKTTISKQATHKQITTIGWNGQYHDMEDCWL
jgi:hypothetical protein